jgi:predicted transport protein
MSEIYSELKSAILNLGKETVCCFRRKQAFVSVVFLRSKLKAYLNIETNQINDPLKKARDVRI